MRKRPLAATITGYVYIAAGTAGFLYHFTELLRRPAQPDAFLVEFIRLLAIVAGVFLLRGRNWARWLALAWMGYHVILSAFHALPEFAIHFVLLMVIGWALLRPPANRYFSGVPVA